MANLQSKKKLLSFGCVAVVLTVAWFIFGVFVRNSAPV